MSDSAWDRWEEQQQLHICHGPQRVHRSCPGNEGQEEGPKLSLQLGEGWAGARAL